MADSPKLPRRGPDHMAIASERLIQTSEQHEIRVAHSCRSDGQDTMMSCVERFPQQIPQRRRGPRRHVSRTAGPRIPDTLAEVRTLRPDMCAACAHLSGSRYAWVAARKKVLRLGLFAPWPALCRPGGLAACAGGCESFPECFPPCPRVGDAAGRSWGRPAMAGYSGFLSSGFLRRSPILPATSSAAFLAPSWSCSDAFCASSAAFLVPSWSC